MSADTKLRSRGSLFFILVMLVTLGTGPEVSAAPTKVLWSPCFQAYGPYECSIVQVPLDYANPGGAAIDIALVRLPATDPAHRIGSLFLNPGGPGGSGIDFVTFVGPTIYTPEVRARFDIVGFDPRGVGRSTALRCFGTTKQLTAISVPFAFPTSPEQIGQWITADLAFDSACAQRGGRLLDHMSAINVARDMDQLRAAVGDALLTYAGFSYGSYLGTVYANLFPDRVRAVLIDGIVDPIAWSTGYGTDATRTTAFTRLGTAKGSRDVLNEFFQLCDAGGPSQCAFAPDAAARFAALAARLRQNPVAIPLSDGSVLSVDYSILIATTARYLYSAPAYPELAGVLAQIESGADLAAVGRTLTGLDLKPGLIPKRGIIQYWNFPEAQGSVVCTDTANPHSYAAWTADAASAESQFGYFGPYWSWLWSACIAWPGTDASAYTGPFDRPTKNPVLVIGEQFDPATPYDNALRLSALMPNAALLTVHGWGHSANASWLSGCAIDVAARYLTDLKVPSPGTVCDVDTVPFVP